MKYEDFLDKLTKVQASLNKMEGVLTFVGFSLNGVEWFSSQDFSKGNTVNITSIHVLKKDMPEKLLFKNIDIIKEHEVNAFTSFNRQIYTIDPDDFFNKLKF